PAAARIALFAAAMLFDNDLHRHPDQRPHVGCHHAVATRNQHDLIFPGQRSHDLRNPRVDSTRVSFQFFQQANFFCIGQAGYRILRQIELATPRATHYLRGTLLAAARYRTRSLCGRFQRWEADIVGVREGGFFAADGTYAHPLVDVETAGLHHAFFQAPAFGTRILEVQIGIIDFVGHDLSEYMIKTRHIETVRG